MADPDSERNGGFFGSNGDSVLGDLSQRPSGKSPVLRKLAKYVSDCGDDDDDDDDLSLGTKDHHHDDHDELLTLQHDDSLWWGAFRNACGRFVNSTPVVIVVSVLIVLSALIMGTMTYPSIQEDEELYQTLETIDMVLLSIFSVEITINLIYQGYPWRNRWVCFDFVVIVLSWAFLNSSIAVFRSFRIFRIFGLFSRWDSLRTLFEAMGRTVPSMLNIWGVLVVLFYTFTVLYTNLYQDLYAEGYLSYPYFETLSDSFLTLFQMMTLDSWTDVVREVNEARPFASAGFVFWVIITAFFMMNLLIAVVCESLRELAEIQEKKRQKKLMKQQNLMFTNQKRELMHETQQLLRLQQKMIRQQQETNQTLLEVLKAVSPESFVADATGELKRRALDVKLPDFDAGGASADDETMRLLEQMAESLKQRAIERGDDRP